MASADRRQDLARRASEIFSTAKTGDIVATICCANAERKVSAPISGTVLEVNGSLKSKPSYLSAIPTPKAGFSV